VQHEPLAMFPEQSSTIPDNSPTQQRLVNEAIFANAPPVSTVGVQVSENNESSSSIPWSAYIDTESVRGRTRHENIDLLTTSIG